MATRTMQASRTRNAYYVEGNTVRKSRPQYSARSDRYEEERRQSLRRIQAERKAAEHTHIMNVAYLFFMVIALAATGVILYFYISLQSAITTTTNKISAKEHQLAALTQENNEAYNRIEGNVDLEEIRRVAIQEYGMRYVDEGQIVNYSDGGGTDFVRQSADIPEAGN